MAKPVASRGEAHCEARRSPSGDAAKPAAAQNAEIFFLSHYQYLA
jgi:hypothetical protein